jgi:hypothetical protein
MIYIVCTLSRRTKNRDNRRIGLKALVILPPISWETQFVLDSRMTADFAQLSDIHRWQTMPGFQLSKTENCVGQSPADNRRIFYRSV